MAGDSDSSSACPQQPLPHPHTPTQSFHTGPEVSGAAGNDPSPVDLVIDRVGIDGQSLVVLVSSMRTSSQCLLSVGLRWGPVCETPTPRVWVCVRLVEYPWPTRRSGWARIVVFQWGSWCYLVYLATPWMSLTFYTIRHVMVMCAPAKENNNNFLLNYIICLSWSGQKFWQKHWPMYDLIMSSVTSWKTALLVT